MILPWKDERHISHRSFRIVDILGEDTFITGKTFEDCTIYGPAVLVPIDRTTMDQIALDGPLDAIFWEVPEDRMMIIGAVGLIDCTFRRCKFHGLGIGGKRPLLELFARALGVPFPARPDSNTH